MVTVTKTVQSEYRILPLQRVVGLTGAGDLDAYIIRNGGIVADSDFNTDVPITVSGIASEGKDFWIVNGSVIRKITRNGTEIDTITANSGQANGRGCTIHNGKLYVVNRSPLKNIYVYNLSDGSEDNVIDYGDGNANSIVIYNNTIYVGFSSTNHGDRLHAFDLDGNRDTTKDFLFATTTTSHGLAIIDDYLIVRRGSDLELYSFDNFVSGEINTRLDFISSPLYRGLTSQLYYPIKKYTSQYFIKYERITKTISSSYEIEPQVSKTVQSEYSVRGVISKTHSSSYQIEIPPPKRYLFHDSDTNEIIAYTINNDELVADPNFTFTFPQNVYGLAGDGKDFWSVINTGTTARKYNREGTLLDEITLSSSNHPEQGAVIHDGKLYIVNAGGSRRVFIYNIDDGTQDSSFSFDVGNPRAIAIHNGIIYISVLASDRLYAFDLDGNRDSSKDYVFSSAITVRGMAITDNKLVLNSDAGQIQLYSLLNPSATNSPIDTIDHDRTIQGATSQVFYPIQKRDSEYAINERITKSHSSQYQIETKIVKTIQSSYSINERIVKAHSSEYSVNERISKTYSSSYEVETILAKRYSSQYQIETRITKTVPASYSVVERVSKNIPSRYRLVDYFDYAPPSDVNYIEYEFHNSSQVADWAIHRRINEGEWIEVLSSASERREDWNSMGEGAFADFTYEGRTGPLDICPSGEVLGPNSHSCRIKSWIRSSLIVSKTYSSSYEIDVPIRKSYSSEYSIVERVSKDIPSRYRLVDYWDYAPTDDVDKIEYEIHTATDESIEFLNRRINDGDWVNIIDGPVDGANLTPHRRIDYVGFSYAGNQQFNDNCPSGEAVTGTFCRLYTWVRVLQKTFPSSYQVIKRVSKTIPSRYTITERVEKTTQSDYSITERLSKEIPSRYRLVDYFDYAPTDDVNYIEYELHNSSQFVQRAIHRRINEGEWVEILSTVSNEQRDDWLDMGEGEYADFTYAGDSGPLNPCPSGEVLFPDSYNCRVRSWIRSSLIIQKRFTSEYSVTERVSKTHSSSYQVELRVENQTPSEYSILQRITKTHISRYSINERITKPIPAQYSILQRITKTTPSNYSIRNTLSQTTPSQYAILFVISHQTRSNYSITTIVAGSINSSYEIDVIFLRTIIQSNYSIRKQILVDIRSLYSIFGRQIKYVGIAQFLLPNVIHKEEVRLHKI